MMRNNDEAPSKFAYRIGEVSRLTGFHPDTIRRLEERGKIKPARDFNNQRRFSHEDIERLRELAGAATRSVRAGSA